MDAKLHRRVQRYGWDLAAQRYGPLWCRQLSPMHERVLARAGLRPGERVLDAACGTGVVALAAAVQVSLLGEVRGIDLSGQMVEEAQAAAWDRSVTNASFERMDAEGLRFAPGSFDVVLCSLGLMYMPHPDVALREFARVLRPGGILVASVWGERARCGWAEVFPIVDAEVQGEVCPLFFSLGQGESLAWHCSNAGLDLTQKERLRDWLEFEDDEAACGAAFVGGPAALAWSRFDAAVRDRVCTRYREAIARWRRGNGYRLPGEFVIVTARKRG